MASGVWDGLDKERVSRGMVTAFLSDEYLEALAAKVKASRGSITPEGEAMLTQARAEVKRRGGEPGATGTQCGGGCKGMGHESKHS